MSHLALLDHSPDAALLALVAGLLLIYLELNRPGLILPGCAGLLTIMLAVAAFLHMQLSLTGVACLAVSACLFLAGLRRSSSLLLASAATLGVVLGSLALVRGPDGLHIHFATALVCGLLLGPGTTLLTAVALRARVNKGLD